MSFAKLIQLVSSIGDRNVLKIPSTPFRIQNRSLGGCLTVGWHRGQSRRWPDWSTLKAENGFPRFGRWFDSHRPLQKHW